MTKQIIVKPKARYNHLGMDGWFAFECITIPERSSEGRMRGHTFVIVYLLVAGVDFFVMGKT